MNAKMYSEWTSLFPSLQSSVQKNDHCSILHKFSPVVSREIVNLTVKQLCTEFGIIYSTEPSVLKTDKEVLWCMEIICYGLSLPLEDHDTIRDCVNIYCEWLSAFNTVPNISVPKPICQDVNYYAQKIIVHFLNLFVPRREEGTDLISKQVVLCHRVLRTLQHIAQFSTKVDSDTWNCLLVFLLDITDVLLTSTILPINVNTNSEDDVGDHLCQRVLGVLLEVWLNACIKCFPSPSLWKTLHEVCLKWKFHTAVIDLWNRVNYVLTSQILRIMYKIPHHSVVGNDDLKLLAFKMDNDCLVQAWYRFLKIIGNPVELCQPMLQQPAQFLQSTTKSSSAYNSFLNNAWTNFYNAMKGVSELIHILLDSFTSTAENSAYVYGIPTCNSILHLFGEWLYEAAYMGTEITKQCSGSTVKDVSVSTSSSNSTYSNVSSQSGSLTGVIADKVPLIIDSGRYNVGYSEAIGALCHIFCSKKTKEEILPVYLSRLYIILHQAFKINEQWDYDEMMSSIIFNSSNLLRIDLDGVLLLITSVIHTLEFVLSDKFRLRKSVIKGVEIRRSAIHLLLSVLPLPTHFENMVLKEPINSFSKLNADNTFGYLKSHLANILINALQTESDPYNTHLLLCGVLFAMQDSALCEEACSLRDKYRPDGTDSAYLLYVRGMYLICQHLTSVWKMDLNTSFAALEMLSSVSKLQIQESVEELEMKWVIRWLCDFIIYQCWRPPQAHSKDLHSSIVGAFNCASMWLVSNRSILHDKECLTILLEVIELGISGIKMDGKSDNGKMKDNKSLKPVSLRVRNAAEGLLSTILEQIDCFFLTKSTSSPHTLEEFYLIESSQCQQKAVTKYQHFVLENNIMSISHIPVANEDDFQPMVLLLVRNGYGRYTWLVQLRQFPRYKSLTRQHQMFNSWRPVSMLDVCNTASVKSSFFPEITPRIPSQSVDKSMPSLEQLSDSIFSGEPLPEMIEKQQQAEQQCQKNQVPFVECNALPSNNVFCSGRLFLSHFSHFSKFGCNADGFSITPLNSNSGQLEQDLLNLDATTSKTTCTCYVLYIKTGQKNYKDILNNITNEGSLCEHFLEVLHSLGWPVKICPHSNWSSYIPGYQKSKFSENIKRNIRKCDLCIGGSNTMFWNDILSQILFIIPTLVGEGISKKETANINTSTSKSGSNVESIILLIWIESLEDSLYFPLADVLNYIGTKTPRYDKPLQSQECYIIFLHPLQNGLIHVKLQSPHNRTNIATPLANGIVISKRSAGLLIRQTIININKRKIFESEDSCLQAHVYRKSKIQEISHKYTLKASYPELLEKLTV